MNDRIIQKIKPNRWLQYCDDKCRPWQMSTSKCLIFNRNQNDNVSSMNTKSVSKSHMMIFTSTKKLDYEQHYFHCLNILYSYSL